MPSTEDRIFIAIGVSNPGGGLEPLPGAVRAAQRMADWARTQGYATVLVHDGGRDGDEGGDEVTVDLLRQRITAAIHDVTAHSELRRLVVFFAGHGAALAVGDQYWILSQWNTRPTEAIKVSSLQRMLEYYGPRQVAIIGDACQEFSARFIDVVGSPVLDMPDEAQRHYELDQFFAVDAGRQAFMIRPADGDDAFCLFTEVLLDALEGDAGAASFERIDGDCCVTSQSLALYLEGSVAREAGRYNVLMSPRPRPGFYTDRVYARLPSTPGTPASAPSVPAAVPAPAPPARPPAGHGAASPGPPRPGRGTGQVRLARPPERRPNLLERARRMLLTRRERLLREFQDEVGAATVRDHFETGCGICISGAGVAGVEVSSGRVERVDPGLDWFRVAPGDGDGARAWTDALVRLDDGRVVAACLLRDHIAALHVLDATTLSLLHRPIGAHERECDEAIALLACEHAGLLDREAVIRAAARYQRGEQRIPTVGCIAAQFHDSLRDVDSLNALAAFHATAGRPLPLDIALYAGLRIDDGGDGLFADIPAGRTPPFDRYPIAGRIPWMRHAWGAVATTRCGPGAEAWRAQALAALAHLAPGAFTAVTAAGHDALRELAGIRVAQPLASA